MFRVMSRGSVQSVVFEYYGIKDQTKDYKRIPTGIYSKVAHGPSM
jgi:hypothetical protein